MFQSSEIKNTLSDKTILFSIWKDTDLRPMVLNYFPPLNIWGIYVSLENEEVVKNKAENTQGWHQLLSCVTLISISSFIKYK